MRNMLHIQYENYKIRQESIDLINQKYHDLKHQIAVLRAESGEKRNAVLDNVEQETKPTRRRTTPAIRCWTRC